MYTGVIETTGTVRAVEQNEQGTTIRITAETTDIDTADSVSVSGVCVTAESVDTDGFKAALSTETVTRTYLATLSADAVVNIERPVPADGRFHGHVVKGTVDTVTEIIAAERRGDGWQFRFSIPEGYEPYLVEKGSVALDGISLTVSDVSADTFSVAVVPETYDRTTLATKDSGDRVHFEADILAKYAASSLA
ncbi:riboflavin synthase [Haloarcula sp. CBA1127]|uniref:riboflavin synthase n=1 Tax=Haloarcula sp. CBA1127 TaxID=1765055 RepID=UPI00073ECDE0|nr:riboflavin synthase [Haloarcula sp. CBA1127]